MTETRMGKSRRRVRSRCAVIAAGTAFALTGAEAFSLRPATSTGKQAGRGRTPLRLMSTAGATLDPLDLAKLYGRLSEKMIFLDGSAGACCHSGCPECPFRYDFDILKAGRPKWVPVYTKRSFDDGREHISKWSTIFHEPTGSDPATAAAAAGGEEEGQEEKKAGATVLSKEQFCERVAALDFAMPMGPSGIIKPDDPPSQDALEALWERAGGTDSAGLDDHRMLQAIGEWSDNGDSVLWRTFQSGMAAAGESA